MKLFSLGVGFWSDSMPSAVVRCWLWVLQRATSITVSQANDEVITCLASRKPGSLLWRRIPPQRALDHLVYERPTRRKGHDASGCDGLRRRRVCARGSVA